MTRILIALLAACSAAAHAYDGPVEMTFPVVSYRDTVRVHKALLDSLGVKKLHAVAGASGGSIQAMEWAALYPAFVDRVVHVIGPGFDIHPYVIQMLDLWTSSIA
jgi:homoserine O-acetyltransferase